MIQKKDIPKDRNYKIVEVRSYENVVEIQQTFEYMFDLD